MNFLPLVGFYYRRHDKISALLKGSAGSGGIVVDFAKALAPVVKKHWPQLNEDGLLDDALATLEAVLTDDDKSDPNYPDPKDR